jgi:hypothetical protein
MPVDLVDSDDSDDSADCCDDDAAHDATHGL